MENMLNVNHVSCFEWALCPNPSNCYIKNSDAFSHLVTVELSVKYNNTCFIRISPFRQCVCVEKRGTYVSSVCFSTNHMCAVYYRHTCFRSQCYCWYVHILTAGWILVKMLLLNHLEMSLLDGFIVLQWTTGQVGYLVVFRGLVLWALELDVLEHFKPPGLLFPKYPCPRFYRLIIINVATRSHYYIMLIRDFYYGRQAAIACSLIRLDLSDFIFSIDKYLLLWQSHQSWTNVARAKQRR